MFDKWIKEQEGIEQGVRNTGTASKEEGRRNGKEGGFQNGKS